MIPAAQGLVRRLIKSHQPLLHAILFGIGSGLPLHIAAILTQIPSLPAIAQHHLQKLPDALLVAFVLDGANRLDAPYAGESKVILPNGAVASRAGHGQTDYVFQYLNLVWARDKQIRPGTDLIKNRRPEFYGPFKEASRVTA